jgi:hypothetical protein
MRARVVLILTILGLAMAVTVAPVAAGGGSLSIGSAGADGEVGGGFVSSDGGTTWVASGQPAFCNTGVGPTGEQFRFALEFPLDDLPASATVTSATLSLRQNSSSFGIHPQAIYGYPGGGSVGVADATVSGLPVAFTSTTTASREDHDVTALLTPGVVIAGWAGFSLRQEPVAQMFTFSGWDCPANLFSSLFPIMTITYDLPATPAASLSDAATAPPATGSPLATLGFGLFLVGALGAVAFVNRGARRGGSLPRQKG